MNNETNNVLPVKGTTQKNNNIAKYFLIVVALIIVGGLSFYAGVSYQKGHAKTSSGNSVATNGAGGFGPGDKGGRAFGGGNRSFGKVTDISANSITVLSSSTGDSTTYTINSSTQITDNGQSVTYSDIQDGDTVIVSASSSSSTTASRILVNPSFGGFGNGGASSNSNSSGSSD